MTRLRSVSLLAVAGLAASVLAPSGMASLPTASAADGLSLGPVVSIPATNVPREPDVIAGTGTRFIISLDAGGDLYTPDNGTTWQQVPPAFAVADDSGVEDYTAGYGGTFVGMRVVDQAAQLLRLQKWSPDTGAVTTFAYDLLSPFDSESDGLHVSDYVGSTVVLNDGRVFDISGDQLVRLQPAYAATPKLYQGQYALSNDGATVVRAGFVDSMKYGYLNVAPTHGGAGAVLVRVDGLLNMDVSGTNVHYLVGTKKSLRLCKAAVAMPTKSSCTTVVRGDYRYSKLANVQLGTSAGADQIYVSFPGTKGERRWIVQGGKKAKVTLRWLGFRDTTKPMAIAYSKAAKLNMAATVSGSGKATPLFATPPQPAAPSSVAMTTGRVAYLQDHYKTSTGTRTDVWVRALNGSVLGAETRLTTRNVYPVVASAARTAVQVQYTSPTKKYQVVFYDGAGSSGSHVSRTRNPLAALSGPYARLRTSVVRVDGKEVAGSLVAGAFGSLVIEASSTKRVVGRTFRIRDLERPGAAPVNVALPKLGERIYRTPTSSEDSNWLFAGDWIVASYIEGNIYGQVAFNYRTQQAVDLTAQGWVYELGDGWVVLSNSGAKTATVHVLATGQTLVLPTGAQLGNVEGDGIRTVGWEVIDEDFNVTFKIAELQGLVAVAPRLLGTLAPTTFKAKAGKRWSPKFDLTKAIAAGTLEIRDASGTLVRSLATRATSTGSVRGVSWNGRNAEGKLVRAGKYTWTLAVAAADGSGAALSVDGLRSASGTLKVTR